MVYHLSTSSVLPLSTGVISAGVSILSSAVACGATGVSSFDAFNHDTPYEGEGATPQANAVEATNDETPVAPQATAEDKIETSAEITPVDNGSTEEVDKW